MATNVKKVLVGYASKHGSTHEIAEFIAARLRESGLAVETLRMASLSPEQPYDAAVLGSGIYYGSWLGDAVEFVRHNQAELGRRPVWLFSSGPLGAHVEDAEEQPKDIASLREAIHPRGHEVFFGALDRSRLSFPERMIVKGVRAPEGDFRDWARIEDWARGIAGELAGAAPGMESGR
jgi:menaquinone-dependent protoporphyrinogen oxidase